MNRADRPDSIHAEYIKDYVYYIYKYNIILHFI